MWIFCKHGFFSAVKDRDHAGNLLVRARFPGDLERLIDSYFEAGMAKALKKQIRETPTADYAYRISLSQPEFASIVASVASEIDYDNFKDSVHGERIRDGAYIRCWFALRDAQEEQIEQVLKKS